MDAFYFCWQALVKESEKHKVNIWNQSSKSLKALGDLTLPKHRIAYVYKRGPLIINLLQCSMIRSITSDALPLYYQLAAKDICNICCLSTGPGLEIVGFLSAFRRNIYEFKGVSVTVVSNFFAWRDFSEALICVNQYHPSNETCDYLSPNFFEFAVCSSKAFSNRILQSIKKADVLIMYNYKSACRTQSFEEMMQEITSLMKKDALLFFLHSKTKHTFFKNLEDKGTCLIHAMPIKVENLPYDASLSSIVGVPPKTKGSSQLTLWQKKSFPCSIEMNFKHKFQNQSSDSQCVSLPVKHGSESSMLAQHSNSSNLINFSQHKTDSNSLSNSTLLFFQPKSNSQNVETALRDFKKQKVREKSDSALEVKILHEVQSSAVKELIHQPQSSAEIIENTLHHSSNSIQGAFSVANTSLETSNSSEDNLPKLKALYCNLNSCDMPKSNKESGIELKDDSFAICDFKEQKDQIKKDCEEVKIFHEVQPSDVKELISQPKSRVDIIENTLHHSANSIQCAFSVSNTSLETSNSSKDNLSKLNAVVCNPDSRNVSKSDKESEIELEDNSVEYEQSKIIDMLEHCERLVTDLEEKISILTLQLNSSENLCNTFCACHRSLICYPFCLPSHQNDVLYSVDNCCHYNHCHNFRGK